MKILVTGAAGFIGSHLCETLLDLGTEVIGLDNFDPFYSRSTKEKNLAPSLKHPHFRFIEGDVNDVHNLITDARKIDLVIHLAAKVSIAPSIENPSAYIQSNILATQILLDFLRENKIEKLIFSSSSSVYGNNKKQPFTEDDPSIMPISPYAYTKKSCELMIYAYHHLYKIDALCLRLFTVYGPRQRPDLVIHKFVKLIQEGKPVTIYGDGTTSRDYTFISDVVKGVESCIHYLSNNKNVYEILNIGSGRRVTISTLVKTIQQLMNKHSRVINLNERPGDAITTYANIKKAERLIGYNPGNDFTKGVESFIAWYRMNQKD